MATPKIEAIKIEVLRDVSRVIFDPEDLKKEVTKTIILAVVSETIQKLSRLQNFHEYDYSSGRESAIKLEHAVSACLAFVDFAYEIRADNIIKLTSGNKTVSVDMLETESTAINHILTPESF